MKIVIYDVLGFSNNDIAKIRSVASDATVVVSAEEDLAIELKDAEVFFGYHTPEVFADADQLKWIQATAAGMDVLLSPEVKARNILVTNASGVHAPQVAEMAWALTLSIARGVALYVKQQREHHWEWGPLYDIDGQTAGVIGLGGIGRRYARVAAAFGMKVLAVDAHAVSAPDFVDSLWGMDRLDELIERADVILTSCPYTDETHHLINAERIAKMKPTAIVVNIARGGIIDEDALSVALLEGRIAGAGIDVCETEPLPSDSPLWDVPNLVVTPHCGGLGPARMGRLAQFFCENLRRYLDAEPLRNVVDQEKGYPV